MKKVIENYFYNVGYQILLILLPLVTTPYVSRVLGAENLGTYSYTNSITQFFILFGCIGLNLYGQREIAYVQEDEKAKNKVFWELVILRVITICVCIIVFCATCVQNAVYGKIFLIQLLDIVAAAIDISWFFQGMEDFKRVVIRNFVVRLICVILIFILVKSSNDLFIYVLIYSSILVIGNISIWFCLPNYILKRPNTNLNLQIHLKPAIMIFLPQIAVSLYSQMDKTMLGALCKDNSEVAFYEQAQIIVKAVMVLITSISTAMMPRIANLFKNEDIAQINNYMQFTLKFVYLLSFAFSFGICAISAGFVPWFYGSEYLRVILNINILAPIILIISLNNVFGTQYLIPLGRQKEYTVSVILGAFSNFLLNLILIPIFLSRGAAIASVIAETIVCITQLYFLRKSFSIRKVAKGILKYGLMGSIMYIVVIIESSFVKVSILSTILEIFTGIIIYIVLLVLTKDEIIIHLKNRIMR